MDKFNTQSVFAAKFNIMISYVNVKIYVADDSLLGTTFGY